ncbi:hypothetical protein [Paenibacillus piri]|uniref:Uncharacterized protein n=1 Tax=Paenibacillus piri TaxID=2547395 RepID=A0A4R5KLX5_9BACL|nr:hypothetical protein [Paenibacillus piri]TDF96212.1 hypothetical protein E1757_17605 [Paenibacillus piri]
MRPSKLTKKNIGTNIPKIEPWILMLSLLISLLITIQIFKNLDISLHSFTDRSIGIVVMDGVDASLRTFNYIKLLLIFTILLLFLLFFISWINNILKPKIISNLMIEKNVIAILSAFSICLILLYIIGNQNIHLIILSLLIFLLTLVITVMFFKVLFFQNKNKYFRLNPFSNYNINILGFLLPIVCIFLYWVVTNGDFKFSYKHLFVIAFTWLFIHLIYYKFLKKIKSKTSFSLINKAIIISGIPIIFIPFSIPISNEIQFMLSAYLNIPARIFSLIIIIFLLFFSVLTYIYIIKRKLKFNISKAIYNIYFPIIIATFVLFNNYTSFINKTEFDMFHDGEDLITNQQLFSFNHIPFIHTYPTHGLSSMIFQMAYSFFNGYRPVETWLWNWMFVVFSFVLLYFIIKKVMSPLIAVLIVLCLPIQELFSIYFAISIIPALLLGSLLTKGITKVKLYFYWIICALMFLWRVDFGVALLASSFGIILLVFINRMISKDKKTIIDLRELINSFFIVFGLCTTLAILLIVYSGQSIKDLFILNFQFVRFQAAVQAYTTIIKNYSPTVVLQYVILPSVSLFYVTWFSYRVFTKKGQQNFNSLQISLILLSVFSLIMSIRSTQRHSLMEIYNPYLFGFLALCIPSFLNKFTKNKNLVLFLGILVIYILFVPTNLSHQIKNDSLFSFKNYVNKESRVSINDSQYKNISDFLNTNLSKDQTFFEFTNNPMLYVGSNKELLTYIIPTVYNASDPVQKIEVNKLTNYINKNKIPYVIFKQGNFWDYLDNVPNEIRSYRIAELIYKNYKPLGTIDNFQIWSNKDSSTNINEEKEKNINFKNFNEIQLHNVVVQPNSKDKLIVSNNGNDPYFSNFLQIEKNLLLKQNKFWFLKVKYNVSKSGDLQVFYSFNNKDFNKDDIRTVQITENQNVVYIPIPVSESKNILSELRFDPPDNSTFEINSVSLVEQENSLIPIKGIYQNFDLLKLPYIWANYDSNKSVLKTEVLKTIINSEQKINKNVAIKIGIDSNIDKSTGNYIHLRIKSDKKSNVLLAYGPNKSVISFELVPSNNYEDYLIRISSQWEWMSENIDFITLQSNENIAIEKMLIRKGD